MSKQTDWHSSRVAKQLSLRYPIIQGPFGGGNSSVALAAAVSNASGLGSYGAHHLDPQDIKQIVQDIRNHTNAPFNINLWIPLADEAKTQLSKEDFAQHLEQLRPYYERLGAPLPIYKESWGQDFEAQIQALLEVRPPIVSFVFGYPNQNILQELQKRGIQTIATATTVEEAITLEQNGIDLIVASGSDAGGHRGAFLRPVHESLVGTFSLVPQVASAVSIPVIAAGGIADARGINAAFALGAEGVQIGTGFLVTIESAASLTHKAALTNLKARVTVLTNAFSGRLARAIPNQLSRDLLPDASNLAPYPIQSAMTAPLREAAATQGNNDYLNLWAGQAAPLTQTKTASEYFNELVTTFESLN